jgi:hypothetical protein
MTDDRFADWCPVCAVYGNCGEPREFDTRHLFVTRPVGER